MSAEEANTVAGPSLSQFSPFFLSNPSNIFPGLAYGVSNIMIGVTVGVGIMLATPAQFAHRGYSQSQSVAGAIVDSTVGFVGGLLIGVPMGAVVIIGGVGTCLWQLTFGTVRTPNAVYATMVGQDFDSDTCEFVRGNLPNESKKTLISDEQFRKVLDEKKSLYEVFKSSESDALTTTNLGGNEASTSIKSQPKKSVADRTLYDILGVEPEATPGEIKKSYYLKARQNHPDRNPDDPEAKAKFQKIGEAYQVLSDERQREVYDSHGKDAVASSNKMDAATLYAMLFGTELFDNIIGELQIATQIRTMSEAAAGRADPAAQQKAAAAALDRNLVTFRQRKRVVQLALHLVAKLDAMLDAESASASSVAGESQKEGERYSQGQSDTEEARAGAETSFMERLRAEAKELCETSLGAAVLDLVGSIYIDRSRLDMGYLDYVGIGIKTSLSSMADSVGLYYYGAEAFITAMDVKRQQETAEKRRRKAGAPPAPGPSLDLGPGATEAEKAHFNGTKKKLGANGIEFLWRMSKIDITDTVIAVCTKVLHDHSQSSDKLYRRCQALKKLGELYCSSAEGSSLRGALDELLKRVSEQSGMFGDNSHAHESEIDPEKAATTASGDESSASSTFEVLEALESMGVKDLMQTLDKMGYQKEREACVEKEDLRRLLRAKLVSRLSESHLRQYAKTQPRAGVLNGVLDPDTCDAATLRDTLLQIE